jgi:hypothetical protein
VKFRFVTSVGGAVYSFVEGTVIEPTEIDAQIKEWLDARVIVPVRDDGLEIAVVAPVERAVTVQGRRGRAGRHARRAEIVAR